MSGTQEQDVFKLEKKRGKGVNTFFCERRKYISLSQSFAKNIQKLDFKDQSGGLSRMFEM